MSFDSYHKSTIFLRGWLAGHNYHLASKALDFARNLHIGVRKDGVTPEFAHIIAVTQFIRTLHNHLIDPEETLATSLLHDVREDYSITDVAIRNMFGIDIADAVESVTKEYIGVKKSHDQYFFGIVNNHIASVVKGADRIHNHQSMVGVFTLSKQIEYIEETEKYILPTLKRARHLYPEQESVYENIKLMLNSQIELVRAIHYTATGEDNAKV